MEKTSQIQLKDLNREDLIIVKAIYDYYVLNTTATFHTEPVTLEELQSFMYIGHSRFRSFLIQLEDEIVGYCYLAPYKNRQAYDRTAELSIYFKPEITGKGLGKEVLMRLEREACSLNFHVLLGIITGENINSLKLFEKCGYIKCAHFKCVGEKFGRILDVIAVQKILSN